MVTMLLWSFIEVFQDWNGDVGFISNDFKVLGGKVSGLKRFYH